MILVAELKEILKMAEDGAYVSFLNVIEEDMVEDMELYRVDLSGDKQAVVLVFTDKEYPKVELPTERIIHQHPPDDIEGETPNSEEEGLK